MSTVYEQSARDADERKPKSFFSCVLQCSGASRLVSEDADNESRIRWVMTSATLGLRQAHVIERDRVPTLR